MDNNIEKEKLVFRKLNKNDKNLFVELRFAYFSMSDFVISEIEKNKIKNNLITYFDENIENGNFLGMICEYKKKLSLPPIWQ
ncbi:hypothetical protein K7I13_08685 [Brucepastera parasyntrophica]|uniref:hypothetical protein n=1 Tax=Brucepastera parasyntrophica TaxID=2880008 RepID=UPI00210A43FE|nr:hypothetical protein [Brucepastera parasyntrophica]ULQ58636.1 hypothetical protein K7I13_08685 [Brucepastera parasyntrophica]